MTAETDEPGAQSGQALHAFFVATAPLVGMAILHNALPVFAPLLMAAADKPPEAYGLVGGALGLGSVWLYMANSAFTVPLGPVRAWKIAAIIAVVGMALVVSGDFRLILLGAVLLGFAYATGTPAGSQILAHHTPRQYRGTMFSLRQAGVPLGGVVAGAGGSWLVAQAGWRPALAILTIAAAALPATLYSAPRAFNESRPLAAFRLSRLLAVSNLLQPFRIVSRMPGLARISAACIGFAAVQGATTAFFVTYMTAGLGFSLTFAGALFAVMLAASAAGRIVLGFLADWAGSPRPVLRALALLSCLSALVLAAMGHDWSAPALFAAVAFVGVSIATWNGLYLAEIANLAPDNVSEATAATTFFVFATYMLTPPVAGLLIAFLGYRAVFLAAAVAATTSAIILAAAPRHAAPG